VARRLGALLVVLAMAALAAGTLSAPFGLAAGWPWLLALAVLSFFWLAGFWRGWLWSAPWGLAGFTLAAAAGLLQGLGAGWMILGLVAALCAWDLHYLAHLLQDLAPAEAHRTLERRHIQRVLTVAGLSLALAAVALTLEVKLTFFLALLLGLLAAWGLGRAVGFLRGEAD